MAAARAVATARQAETAADAAFAAIADAGRRHALAASVGHAGTAPRQWDSWACLCKGVKEPTRRNAFRAHCTVAAAAASAATATAAAFEPPERARRNGRACGGCARGVELGRTHLLGIGRVAALATLAALRKAPRRARPERPAVPRGGGGRGGNGTTVKRGGAAVVGAQAERRTGCGRRGCFFW